MSALSPVYRQAIPLAQQSIAAASISSTYAIVGSKFNQGVVQLLIVSTLDASVQISLDGLVDFIPIPAASTLIIDVKSNLAVFPGYFAVYVKEIGNPTTGSLYVGAIGVE